MKIHCGSQVQRKAFPTRNIITLLHVCVCVYDRESKGMRETHRYQQMGNILDKEMHLYFFTPEVYKRKIECAIWGFTSNVCMNQIICMHLIKCLFFCSLPLSNLFFSQKNFKMLRQLTIYESHKAKTSEVEKLIA